MQEPRALQEKDTHALQEKVEAILFASPKALTVGDVQEILNDETLSFKDIKTSIQAIHECHESRPNGGFHLECLEGGLYQFRTKSDLAPVVERIFTRRPRPLSRAAQETLAIVAYRQPVSRADIEFIRGVDSGSILKHLLERELVTCVGKKDIPGKPMLFGTTHEFLRVYGLSSLEELPPLESFQPKRELMKMANASIEESQNHEDDPFLGLE